MTKWKADSDPDRVFRRYDAELNKFRSDLDYEIDSLLFDDSDEIDEIGSWNIVDDGWGFIIGGVIMIVVVAVVIFVNNYNKPTMKFEVNASVKTETVLPKKEPVKNIAPLQDGTFACINGLVWVAKNGTQYQIGTADTWGDIKPLTCEVQK